MTSTDQPLNYEPISPTPWTGDDQNSPIHRHFPEEPQDYRSSDVSFSFSEDDLLPPGPSSAGSTFGAISYIRAAQPERDARKLYSTTQKAAREPKIKVERAFVVSEPPLSPRSPSPVERKTNRLFRTLSGFRKSTNSFSRTASESSEASQPNGKVVRAQTIEEERPKSSGRARERSRGRPKADRPLPSEPSALAWLPRPKSLDSKKRHSMRSEASAVSDQQWTRSPIKRPRTPVADLDGLKMHPTEQPPFLPQPPPVTAHEVVSEDSSLRKPFARRSLERSEMPSFKDKRRSLKVDTSALTANKQVPANSPTGAELDRHVLPGKQEKRRSLKTLISKSSTVQQLPTPLPTENGSINATDEKSRRKSVKVTQRPKDDLWPKFRTLEHDYQQYIFRPAGSRTASIEASLTSFLKDYANDTTVAKLHPESLERRCAILNKWWTELTDVIDEWDNDDSSYRERSAALDAIIGIMQRPEWRRGPDYTPATLSPTAESSDFDHFMLKSIYHNIRTMFVQSLLRLLATLIERLSSRDGTGVITRAGGMCCAYAFFFCPGIAEHLVRLWRLPSSVIRKLGDSVAPSPPTDLAASSAKLAARFPECVRQLRYISSRNTATQLSRKPADLPLDIRIDWTNEIWLDRWCGKKSDLFYGFLKHFHHLLADFMPQDVSAAEAIRAPGVILVQAQMSLVLKSALVKLQGTNQSIPNIDTTFDGMMNADDSAIPVSNPPREAVRTLTGRRLVMLIKEMLSSPKGPPLTASRLFAHSSRNMLKATARQISLFDHDSCFNLCDFLEQTLAVLTNFDQANYGFPDHDATFWSNVFEQMLLSNNTLTALRVFSLLHTMWPEITQDPPWKHCLCYKLILNEKLFNAHFQHWCPIVRVYYMRLLAWRVARCDGQTDDVELRLLKTLFFRVQESWAHFQYISNEAAARKHHLPSTAPDNPVPGRRLLIIRLDTPPSTAQSDMSTPPAPATPKRVVSSPPKKDDWSASYTQLVSKLSTSIEDGLEQGKRRSGLFRGLSSKSADDLPASKEPSSNATERRSITPSSSSSAIGPSSRASMYTPRPSMFSQLSALNANGQRYIGPGQPLKPIQSVVAAFKFSLEAVERGLIADMELSPPRLPLAAFMALQSQPNFVADTPPSKPTGTAIESARYAGRALAEWSLTVNECQNFFERRRKEGVPSNSLVETPTLGVESFRRPG